MRKFTIPSQEFWASYHKDNLTFWYDQPIHWYGQLFGQQCLIELIDSIISEVEFYKPNIPKEYNTYRVTPIDDEDLRLVLDSQIPLYDAQKRPGGFILQEISDELFAVSYFGGQCPPDWMLADKNAYVSIEGANTT